MENFESNYTNLLFFFIPFIRIKKNRSSSFSQSSKKPCKFCNTIFESFIIVFMIKFRIELHQFIIFLHSPSFWSWALWWFRRSSPEGGGQPNESPHQNRPPPPPAHASSASCESTRFQDAERWPESWKSCPAPPKWIPTLAWPTGGLWSLGYRSSRRFRSFHPVWTNFWLHNFSPGTYAASVGEGIFRKKFCKKKEKIPDSGKSICRAWATRICPSAVDRDQPTARRTRDSSFLLALAWLFYFFRGDTVLSFPPQWLRWKSNWRINKNQLTTKADNFSLRLLLLHTLLHDKTDFLIQTFEEIYKLGFITNISLCILNTMIILFSS